MKLKELCLAGFASLALASTSLAQEEAPPPFWGEDGESSWVEADIGDSNWTIGPIVIDGVLVGLFGVMEYSKATNDNLTIIWAEPDAKGEWIMHGWRHHSPSEAIKWLRNFYADGTILGEFSHLNTGQPLTITTTIQQSDKTPEAIAFGVLVSDPSASLLATTQSAALAEAMIDAGAAGARALSSSMLIQSGCGNVTKLDAELSAVAMVMLRALGEDPSSDMSDALDLALGANWQAQSSLASLCWPCFPSCWNFWNPWSAWSCTGGPTPIAGGGCRFTGCTRSRTGTRVCVDIACNTTSTPRTQNQGPQNKTCNDSPPNSGNCAAQPQPGC